MKLHVWGTDFRRSDAEFRRRLHVPLEHREAQLKQWLSLGFSDLLYVATCNRVEFYTSAPNFYSSTRPQFIALLETLGLTEDDFYRGYHFEGKSALRHLLRTSSSLESLVVGETQILGQIKDAHKWTLSKNLPIHPSLDECLSLAYETAKKVRTHTTVGGGITSVASLGLKHLEAQAERVPLKRVVVVGRGSMSLTVIRWMRKSHPQVPVMWVNRTLDTLSDHLESLEVEAVSLADFLASPPDFSHLFTATGSHDVIFNQAFFDRLSVGNRLIFDFAQPADVSPEAVSDDKGRLIALEGLQKEAEVNRRGRAQAVEDAEALVERAIKSHFLRLKQAPVLRDFSRVEPQFLGELETALERLKAELSSDLPESVQQDLHRRLERWATSLVKKNLHQSREHLRDILTSDEDLAKNVNAL